MSHECKLPKRATNNSYFYCQDRICLAVWKWHEMTGWRWMWRSG